MCAVFVSYISFGRLFIQTYRLPLLPEFCAFNISFVVVPNCQYSYRVRVPFLLLISCFCSFTFTFSFIFNYLCSVARTSLQLSSIQRNENSHLTLSLKFISILSYFSKLKVVLFYFYFLASESPLKRVHLTLIK